MWIHRLHYKIVWNKLFIKAWAQKISIPIQVLAVCLVLRHRALKERWRSRGGRDKDIMSIYLIMTSRR